MTQARIGINVATINQMLTTRRLKYPGASILRPGMSPTVHRLKSLAKNHPKKYLAYMKLINSLLDIAKGRGTEGELVLHLPSAGQLVKLRVERIAENRAILEDVASKCLSKGKLDLRLLWTNRWLFTPGIRSL